MAEKKPTILISEDEADINNLLTLILQSENFHVLQAFDGLSALETFTAHQDEIDLLVTDLGLPKIGGVELIEKVRKMKPSLKIIGASGFGRNNVREEVMQAGADEFMPKPYVTSDLLDLAKRLLGVP
ncbi:MAG: response regulator [Bacteroidota bacterium]